MYDDTWLPRVLHNLKPMPPRQQGHENLRVRDLMNEQGGMEWRKTKPTFLGLRYCTCIRTIAICSTNRSDTWIWNFSRNGLFSTMHITWLLRITSLVQVRWMGWRYGI